MKKLLLFLFFTTSVIADSSCRCGTYIDPQVDRIGDEICQVLIDLEFVEPPKHFWALNESGDEDDPLYVDGASWEPTFTASEYWCVSWRCEYVDFYNFTSDVGALHCCEDTLSLIERLNADIEEVKEREINFINERILYASRSRNPSKHNPSQVRQKAERKLLDELEKTHLLFTSRCERAAQLEYFATSAYEAIFTKCCEKHDSDLAHYHLGFLKLTTGDFFSALEHIKKIKNLESFSKKEQVKAKLELGKTQALLGLYDEAIESLTKVIQRDPKKSEAYFERALAYFEKGQFDKAIEDYLCSDFKSTPISDSDGHALAFAGGLLKGISSGVAHSVENFAPSILCSLNGLANGIWAFACSPAEVSKEMVQAGKNLYEFMRDESALSALKTVIPELDELIGNWSEHTEFRKGELIGTIIGTHGTDIVLGGASIKGLKIYNKMRAANSALALDSMMALEKRSLVLRETGKWHETRVAAIRQARDQAKELGKRFKEVNLTETQARKMLHNLEFKTYAKPKGMNIEDFHVRVSEKGGGMLYVYKKNENFKVRVMPGNELSEWPAQRKPYIVHETSAGRMDKSGKYVSKKAPAAHIPINEYDFKIFEEALKNGK